MSHNVSRNNLCFFFTYCYFLFSFQNKKIISLNADDPSFFSGIVKPSTLFDCNAHLHCSYYYEIPIKMPISSICFFASLCHRHARQSQDQHCLLFYVFPKHWQHLATRNGQLVQTSCMRIQHQQQPSVQTQGQSMFAAHITTSFTLTRHSSGCFLSNSLFYFRTINPEIRHMFYF